MFRPNGGPHAEGRARPPSGTIERRVVEERDQTSRREAFDDPPAGRATAIADAVVEAARATLPELDLVDAEAPAAPEPRARHVTALELGGRRGDPPIEVGAI